MKQHDLHAAKGCTLPKYFYVPTKNPENLNSEIRCGALSLVCSYVTTSLHAYHDLRQVFTISPRDVPNYLEALDRKEVLMQTR